MTVGILLAGGIGERVGAGIPKQFIEISEKPICWYPLKNMEECEQIDAIEVVCVREYMEQMRKIVRDNGFKKVKWIIPGGATCQESTITSKYAPYLINRVVFAINVKHRFV